MMGIVHANKSAGGSNGINRSDLVRKKKESSSASVHMKQILCLVLTV